MALPHAMALKPRRFDRRRPGRPRNGDVKPCPKCGSSDCEFSERYRFGAKGVAPGWLCDAPGCGFRQLVRGEPTGSFSRLIHGSRELRARAQRQMMKPRAKIARAGKRVDVSERRLKRQR